MPDNEHTAVGQARYYHDKKAFIHSQVRLLEALVQPSADWRRDRVRQGREGEHTPIPESVVSAVLSKLHATSRKSLRLSFNNQSVRQLLEQLESNQHDLRKKARQGGIIIRTKSVQEVLESNWIDMFPDTWHLGQGASENSFDQGGSSTEAPSSAQDSTSPSNMARLQKYADQRSRILALQTKYQTLKDKHAYYKTLRSELGRLDSGAMQSNILAPDSQVIQELQKMKVLLPRLLGILDTRRNVLASKRKHPALNDSPGACMKRQRTEPSNPLETVMNFLQE